MAVQHVMNVLNTNLRLAFDLPASFLRELDISPIENFLQVVLDVLELSTITHELRSTAGSPLLIHVPVVIVMITESLLAHRTFPMVG